ncbi:uncharacterized protein PRCAT00004578001 [Priceomyces carsonii]|uniref:uncharacterized protein n=1 Tax=Priceomyces carsonii TaxID=28549 RepID=UPI002ED80C20|nr:unnamed protein product [Priceomyces carsonii]
MVSVLKAEIGKPLNDFTNYSKADDTEKYPPNIQKLFTPKPPLLFKKPTDYASEQRRTRTITPISQWREEYDKYIKEFGGECNSSNQQNVKTISSRDKKDLKKRQNQESFERQLRDWNDPELLARNEQEFMRDPIRTVFIARLDYSSTELDISKNFSKYGMIESIRIIRDKNGKSKGYGFVVFERELDAQNCVRELALRGIKIPEASGSKTRTVLVDIERGRTIRNWKPKRLGGGLGGRHYTRPDVRHNSAASAAASGRTLHLKFHHQQTPPSSYSSSSYGAPTYRPGFKTDHRRIEKPVKDKYAKYSGKASDISSYRSSTSTDRTRSIKSIRQRE